MWPPRTKGTCDAVARLDPVMAGEGPPSTPLSLLRIARRGWRPFARPDAADVESAFGHLALAPHHCGSVHAAGG